MTLTQAHAAVQATREGAEDQKQCAFFICPFAKHSLVSFMDQRGVSEDRRKAMLAWLDEVQHEVESLFEHLVRQASVPTTH